MKKFFLFLLIAIFYRTNLCQTTKLNVVYNNKDFYVSAVTHHDNIYFSVREFFQLFNKNTSFDKKTKKFEVTYLSHKLRITGKNSFVNIYDEGENVKTYQLPVSTLLLNDEIFIPAIFSINFLSDFFSTKFEFNPDENVLLINEIISEEKKSPAIKEPEKTNITEAKKIEEKKYDIEKTEIDEKANGTLIRLKCTRKIESFKTSAKKNKLFVFLNNVTVSPEINNVPANSQIKKIETKKSGTSIQIEFTFDETVSLSDSLQDSMKDFDSNDILITIFKKQVFSQDVNSKINDWVFDTVVIDPGHGGKDPGAIGITGVKEKDVNLAVALKLGEIIKNSLPEVKVVFTRSTDKFVELYKRGKIANENNGKLFISIHCNSLGRKKSDSRGFEVYLLRPGKTKRAIEIAEYENSVIKYEDDPSRYKELTDENFILVSMAHSSFMRYSEKFSEILHNGWNKYVGIPSRGVKQAGFYVLVGASMPGVLIETGFLSNISDEAYLKSKKGQLNIANSIFQAVKKYKNYYDEELKK